MAGVLGSGLYLALVLAFDLEAYQIYFLSLPTVLLYVIAYHCILLPPDPSEKTRGKYDDYTIQLNEADDENKLVVVTEESKWVQFRRCFGGVGMLAFNLFAVYFFEYVASTGAADRANDHNDTDAKFWVKQSYAILAFLYQVGFFNFIFVVVVVGCCFCFVGFIHFSCFRFIHFYFSYRLECLFQDHPSHLLRSKKSGSSPFYKVS